MRTLTLALSALAMIGAVQAAQPRLASEGEFAKLLLGCWGAEWHASLLDGSEESGLDVVCFYDNGRVSTGDGREIGKAQGKYWLADDKLHVKADIPSDWWVLEAAEMTCDVVLQPRESLILRGCVGKRAQLNGALGALDYPIDLYFSAFRGGKE